MPEMQDLAGAITMFLARLTFASLHIFEELGVDMSEVDQAIAEWTTAYQELQAHNADLATQLVAANATVDQLIATDAAEDAQQKADLEAQIAQQIRDALASAQNPPAPPEGLPPVDNSGGEPPVEEPPVEEPPVEEVPVDPGNPSQAPEGEEPQVNPLQ